MRFKIFLIVIILLTGIAAVSGENTTASFEDVQIAIDSSNNDVIYLNNTNYVGNGIEITITKDIILDGSYSNGSGHSTLDAKNLSRIINVKNINQVVLKNINFINGNASTKGGAISLSSEGLLIICNSNFTNNHADNGGAIYSNGTLHVFDGYFTNNSGIERNGTVFSENGRLLLTETYFNNENDGFYVKDTEFITPGILEDEEITLDDSNPIIQANPLGLIGNKDYTLLMYSPLFNGTFPETFDLRTYGYTGPIKNQGSTGTCWAQSTISALESCVLKALNSNQIALLKNKGFSVQNVVEDVIKYIYPTGYYSGGKFDWSIPYLLSWMGPTYESKQPWGGAYEPIIYPSIVHVQNLLNIPHRQNFTDLTAIKQAIMDYGGIFTTIYASGPGGAYGNCFNYYTTPVDHGVCVVGWDDSFSRYNFLPVDGHYPEGDGAFIVQNSWGDQWGRKGFYYVSYYDRTIFASDDSWTFIFNDTVRYNKNYQNSLKGKISSGISGKKVSSTETFTSGGNDYLAAVSAYFMTPSSYEITISVNGKAKLTQTGEKISPGYYTIELDDFIPLTIGDKFTVKITYTGLNGARVTTYNTIEGYPAIKAYTTENIFESLKYKLSYATENSEVFLNGRTIYGSAGDSPITITKNITINGANSNGEGFTTFDAKSLVSIFEITNGCSVTLKNIKLINGANTAISVEADSSLTLINCEFTNNKGRFGNSITAYGNITVVNCVFSSSNNGLCEIYVVGTADFKNNQINSVTSPIYNAGTITSKTYLTFNDATGSLNKPTTLTATLTDDNGNTIETNKINIKDIGIFLYKNGAYALEYIPTNGGQRNLTCFPKGLDDVSVTSGTLYILEFNPIILKGGKSSYGSAPVVSIIIDESRCGIYNLYVDGVKVESCFITKAQSSISINGLSPGIHTILLELGTNTSYSNTTTVEVSKIIPTITLDVKDSTYGIETVISAMASGYRGETLNGTLIISIDNKIYSLVLNNGVGSINLPEFLDEGIYVVTATLEEKEEYNGATAQKTFNIRKATPTATLTLNSITYEDNAVLTVTLNKPIDGDMSFYIDHTFAGRSAVSNGIAQLSIAGVEAGTHSVYAVYEGSRNYNSANSGTQTLNVAKKQLQADFTPYEMYYSKEAIIYISLPSPNYVGYITIIAENQAPIKKLYNGEKIPVSFKGYKPGEYKISIIGEGTKNFEKISQSTIVTMNKLETDMTYEIYGGYIGDTSLKITCPVDANALINLNLNNDKYEFVPTSGIVVLNLDDYAYGNYNMSLGYESENYLVKTINTILNIKPTYKMEFDDLEMYYHDGSRLQVTLTDLENIPITNKKIAIVLNNETYYRTTNDDGKISMAINLPSGKYIAELKYLNLTEEAKINIKPTIISNDLTKYFMNSSQYYVTIVDTNGSAVAGVKVNYNINGMIYTRTTNENGSAKFNINLAPGTYEITVQNTMNNEIRSNKIVVLPTIIANDLTKYYQNDSQYWIKLVDTNGNILTGETATLNINGVLYTRTTNENGTAKFNINLGPGNYIITVMYNGCTISSQITVLSNVACEDLVMSENNRTPFVVTTLDKSGNPLGNQSISLNINGMIYTRTTKENGTALLNMNLMKGEYIITILYNNLLTSKIVRITD